MDYPKIMPFAQRRCNVLEGTKGLSVANRQLTKGLKREGKVGTLSFNTGSSANQGDQEPQRRVGTPEANVNVPPPPRQGSTVWRGTKLAFGGCIVLPLLLLIVLFAGIALIGGSGEEQAEPTGPGQSQDNPVAINDPLQVGDATWIIQNAAQATELSARFSETVQGNFVVVNFSFTNNSDEAVSMDETYLTLIDGQGRRNEADPDKFEYIPDSRYLFYENVNPGVTRLGQAIFTVAPGATDFTIEAASTDVFSDEKGFVELGF